MQSGLLLPEAIINYAYFIIGRQLIMQKDWIVAMHHSKRNGCYVGYSATGDFHTHFPGQVVAL